MCNVAVFYSEALANAGVFVKGEILPDPGSEVPSSHVSETAVRNRPHYKEWYSMVLRILCICFFAFPGFFAHHTLNVNFSSFV